MYTLLAIVLLATNPEPQVFTYNAEKFKTEEACKAVIPDQDKKLEAFLAGQGLKRSVDYVMKLGCDLEKPVGTEV